MGTKMKIALFLPDLIIQAGVGFTVVMSHLV
jgi:hypothetical protein